MAKADPKRNYYADLEVSPDADTDEIRRQFRKLALKWHPDRNQGREPECVPRFQAIQAAHEILGDPVERQKYDVERRKRGVYGATARPNVPPRTGNPYQTTSNFPPPPRRAARAQPPPRPEFRSTASHGAYRFAQDFPKPPPTAQKPGFKDNADAKANVFNAWQNMHHKQKASAPNYAEASGKAKSAWEAANEGKPGVGRSQSTRMPPRKGGFDPATPGADEPPAASTSAYYRTSNYGRPVPPPPPPPRMATDMPGSAGPHYADPLRPFKETVEKEVPFAEGTRTRTPYNSTGGERIFVDPLGRSASQRNSPHPPASPEDMPGTSTPRRSTTRHRSASPTRRKGNATRPFSMYSSSDEEDATGATPRQRADRASQHQASQSAQAGARFDGSSVRNNNASDASKVNGNMGQKSQSSMYGNSPLNQSNLKTPQSRKAWPYWAIPSSVTPPKFSTSHWTQAAGAKKRSNANDTPSAVHPSQRQRNDSANDHISFNFPLNDDTFAQSKPDQFKSKSTESINTKFSPGDWHGTFEGKADYFTGPIPPRARASPVRGRPASAAKNRTPNATFGSPGQMPPPHSPPSSQPSSTGPEAPQANSGPVKFSQEEWFKTFKDPSFVLPANPPKPPSPTKGAPPMRNRKQSKSRTVPSANAKPKPASVADADDDSMNESANVDGSAMDIDPIPAPRATKTVPVPPAAHTQNGKAQAQETDAADTIRLNDLRNVAPFASSSQEGLRDLNDLAQNLPFESLPSAGHPTRSSEPAPLPLPDMPKAPELPQRLTKTTWAEYVAKMGLYMHMFNQFDSLLLQHFAARHRDVEALGPAANWLGAVGDTTTAGGFGSYMRGVKEDEVARMHWHVAWDKHKASMELFEGCRARVLKGGLPA